MAMVYRCTQKSLDRDVALKVMMPEMGADKSMCERFLKEGKIIAKLEHPNIVTIYDIGRHEDNYYMSMEICTKPNLKERIYSKQGVKNPLEVLRQMGDALHCAHERGFIHRDVKPANILFRDDKTPVLTDFGIAKSMQSETQLTAVGWIVGTPDYMGPEQATGKKVDGRADLYSLGVTFYEMLAGAKPYKGEDAFATALMHVNEPIPRLPDKFRAYQPILDRLMAKDPDDRFQTGATLIAQIDVITGVPEEATLITPELQEGGAGTQLAGLVKSPGALWKGLAATVGTGLLIAAVIFLPRLLPEKTADTAPALSPASQATDRGAENDLPPEKRAKVGRLLAVAQAHVSMGRMREPSGSNAYEAFQMVLEIDPGNKQAAEGLALIAKSSP